MVPRTRFWCPFGMVLRLSTCMPILIIWCSIRPSSQPSAWETQARGRDKLNKLLPQHQKNTGAVAQEFNFDDILTGSENKPVYNAVERSHVKAAMEGYNAVCFAYGQTASGKTFTLVCSP